MLKRDRIKLLEKKIRKFIKIAGMCDGWSDKELEALVELEKELKNNS